MSETTNDAPAAATDDTLLPDNPDAQTEQKPEGEGRKDPKWYTDRIATLTRQRHDADRRASAAEMEAAAMRAKIPEAERPPVKPSETNIDALVDQRIAQREHRARVDAFGEAGREEFPDFDERCNKIANLGALERKEFMEMVLDLDDSHKIVAALADDPTEAVRILKLPTAKMAAALAKLAATPPKRANVSAAPTPPRSIDGSARTAKNDPNNMTVAEHQKAIRERNSR